MSKSEQEAKGDNCWKLTIGGEEITIKEVPSKGTYTFSFDTFRASYGGGNQESGHKGGFTLPWAPKSSSPTKSGPRPVQKEVELKGALPVVLKDFLTNYVMNADNSPLTIDKCKTSIFVHPVSGGGGCKSKKSESRKKKGKKKAKKNGTKNNRKRKS
jgi:hypothetical protein